MSQRALSFEFKEAAKPWPLWSSGLDGVEHERVRCHCDAVFAWPALLRCGGKCPGCRFDWLKHYGSWVEVQLLPERVVSP